MKFYWLNLITMAFVVLHPHYCIHSSETYHFADDTHLLNFSKTVWSLCGRVNADLRVLVSWLNANKISLNASKTEFVIFRSPWKRLDCIPRLKLSGKILTPSKSVKYFSVHLDEHLSWKTHIGSIATKLHRANGALSKLRYLQFLLLILNTSLKSGDYVIFLLRTESSHSRILL